MKKNTNKINQSGRSMVEMLGVLAIIGVLSVGGIAGYTTAMNKHKANEILNAASIRAMVVSTQIQNGTSPTLVEFTDTDNKVGGATFGTEVKNTTGTGAWVKGTDNQFSLTLSGVDTKICNQMKNTVGENSIIKAWGDNCTFLTYNNDLGSGKTPSSECEPGYKKQGSDCVVDKCYGIKCSSQRECDDTTGQCVNKSNYTGACQINEESICVNNEVWVCITGNFNDFVGSPFECPNGCDGDKCKSVCELGETRCVHDGNDHVAGCQEITVPGIGKYYDFGTHIKMCDYGCNADYTDCHVPNCMDGEYKCDDNDNTLYQCIQEAWVSQIPCSCGCDGNQCAAEDWSSGSLVCP